MPPDLMGTDGPEAILPLDGARLAASRADGRSITGATPMKKSPAVLGDIEVAHEVARQVASASASQLADGKLTPKQVAEATVEAWRRALELLTAPST